MALLIVIILSFLNLTLGKNCARNDVPEHITWEKKLKEELKCSYRFALVPPPGNETHPFTVNVRFTMKYFTFNSQMEIFTVQNLMYLSWIDERLKWDPKKFFGINETYITSVNIWTPTLRLFNAADSFDFERFYYVRCSVKSTGRVDCMPRMVHLAICSVKLKNWPYDVQECSLEFGIYPSKWTNFRMNYSSRAISMFGAEYGAEWFISDYKQSGNRSSDNQLKMTFVLEREAGGLAAVVVYPALILTFLTVSSLLLDVMMHVRLILVCFSLYSHFYFLSELGMNIPKDSVDPPTLLLYYRASLILTVMIGMVTLTLCKVCRLKSKPPSYILSVNDFVYNGYEKYIVIPEWDFKRDLKENKVNEDWIKFSNAVNSLLIIVTVVTYVGLYFSFVPQPVPIKY